ncbi:hypothetical protein BCR34DRAFT_597705 [Clohesyomyces aquaticus]|uniref:Uncharacterized protein n=1 Tax=Clohesyomyces aquaticus TaxID=1231657 RepID=A0A1Y2A1Y2_9PLEO|nr:hypothetical protein BCR34DRAFT_597705 [Clohesyomyces aquaticus]
MSGKAHEYVDVTKSVGEGAFRGDAKNESEPMSKEKDARAKGSEAQEREINPPPVYSTFTQGSSANAKSSTEDVMADFRSLQVGDPNESISVPMILSNEKRSFKDVLRGRGGSVSQTVIVRKMTRDHYLKHYAKDAEGNYVGTKKAAADAGLVFVPSKSTPEEILEQVRKVAFGKQHHIDDFGTAWSGTGSVAG